MHEQRHMTLNALIGSAGGGISWIADQITWLDPAVRAISFYGGAILVIFSVISVGMDIRRKWRDKREKREADETSE